jgi:hypothetical protein
LVTLVFKHRCCCGVGSDSVWTIEVFEAKNGWKK